MSHNVTPDMIKQLRERTGVSISKCKEALDHAAGDIEGAIVFLRKAGIASAVKKADRETKEGMIVIGETPTHIALVELNAETDFVVQSAQFKAFAHDLGKRAAEIRAASAEAFLAYPFAEGSHDTIDEHRASLIQSLGENIRVRRLEVFAKGSDRSIGAYSHMGGKVAALVEIQGKSGFESLAYEIALHVVAESPDFLAPSDVPASVVEREREIAREQIKDRPPQMVDKIIEGKLEGFYAQTCLIRQPFVKDPKMKIADMIGNASKEAGVALTLTRFARWKVGS